MEHGLVQHLGHHRIHLARHDARSRLNRGQMDLVQASGRAGSQQPDVVRDADQGKRQGSHGGREVGRVCHGLHRFEQVVGFMQMQAAEFRELLHHALVILGMGVQSGPDRRTADPKPPQPLG